MNGLASTFELACFITGFLTLFALAGYFLPGITRKLHKLLDGFSLRKWEADPPPKAWQIRKGIRNG